ncbi:hypothetical protein [Rhabdochlamydiaceae symbiont of Dictyostelium giganteum]|uniref:hypothetical protein n=1 Tax=Rhabdochlamydiaceae symbiont of Dictyostelium giganteum TaxID=3342349 RepID=UPI00384E5161
MSIVVSSNQLAHQPEEFPSLLSFTINTEENRFLSSSPERDRMALNNVLDQPINTALYFLKMTSTIGLMLGASAVAVKLLGAWKPVHVPSLRLHREHYPLYQRVYHHARNYIHRTDSVQLLLTGLCTGVISGLVGGIPYVQYHRIRAVSIRDEAFSHSYQASNKAFEITRLFLADMDTPEQNCPISHQPMIFPVITNCGHIFEFFSVAIKLTRKNPDYSLADSPCPLCKKSISTLTHPKKYFENKTGIWNKIFKKIERLLKKSHIIDGLTMDEIEQIMRKENSFFTRSSEELTALIKQDIKNLSPDELFVLAAFMLRQFKPMHEKIESIYKMNTKQILKLRRLKKLSLENEKDLSDGLSNWYTYRIFIPAQCSLTRDLFEKLGAAQ